MKTVLKTGVRAKIKTGSPKTILSNRMKTKLNPAPTSIPVSSDGGFDYTFDFTFG